MISKFWNVLFKYADEAKESGNMDKLATCREISDLLQRCYDDSKDKATETAPSEKGVLNNLVASIPGIRCLYDGTDGDVFYELDNLYFSTPKSVIEYIIECRRTIVDVRKCSENLRKLSNQITQRLGTVEKSTERVLEKIKKKE